MTKFAGPTPKNEEENFEFDKLKIIKYDADNLLNALEDDVIEVFNKLNVAINFLPHQKQIAMWNYVEGVNSFSDIAKQLSANPDWQVTEAEVEKIILSAKNNIAKMMDCDENVLDAIVDAYRATSKAWHKLDQMNQKV